MMLGTRVRYEASRSRFFANSGGWLERVNQLIPVEDRIGVRLRRNRSREVDVYEYPAGIKFRGSDDEIYLVDTASSVDYNIYKLDGHGCLLKTMCAGPSLYSPNRTVPISYGERDYGQILTLMYDAPLLLKQANVSTDQRCQRLLFRA